MQDYLKGLNEPQLEAATHTKGPLMIVAGAGSGKTKVLFVGAGSSLHSPCMA
jgi:DNA helicase-2/ATP-dependent DNA helicase PcrA